MLTTFDSNSICCRYSLYNSKLFSTTVKNDASHKSSQVLNPSEVEDKLSVSQSPLQEDIDDSSTRAQHKDDNTNYDAEAIKMNGTEENDSEQFVKVSRRIDIVAIAKDRSCVYLIDPTIQIERDEAAVQNALQEKINRYEPTIRWFRSQYPNVKDVKVCGVWFGARGAHHPTTVVLFKELKLLTGNGRVLLDDISKIILRHSSGIMHEHLHGHGRTC